MVDDEADDHPPDHGADKCRAEPEQVTPPKAFSFAVTSHALVPFSAMPDVAEVITPTTVRNLP